jgi:hypothetical protein
MTSSKESLRFHLSVIRRPPAECNTLLHSSLYYTLCIHNEHPCCGCYIHKRSQWHIRALCLAIWRNIAKTCKWHALQLKELWFVRKWNISIWFSATGIGLSSTARWLGFNTNLILGFFPWVNNFIYFSYFWNMFAHHRALTMKSKLHQWRQ